MQFHHLNAKNVLTLIRNVSVAICTFIFIPHWLLALPAIALRLNKSRIGGLAACGVWKHWDVSGSCCNGFPYSLMEYPGSCAFISSHRVCEVDKIRTILLVLFVTILHHLKLVVYEFVIMSDCLLVIPY